MTGPDTPSYACGNIRDRKYIASLHHFSSAGTPHSPTKCAALKCCSLHVGCSDCHTLVQSCDVPFGEQHGLILFCFR